MTTYSEMGATPAVAPETEAPRGANSFAKDEEGTMLIFGMFIFVIMLVAGGMAVDFMRAEHKRAQVQYTLDRAILAGAALSQPLVPEDVVKDYFEKSDVRDYTLTVSPSETGLNFRRVQASATTGINSFFVNMVGIDTIGVAAGGVAEERIQKIEISLVLDVSGSMGNNNKLENLKTAATEFVDTVLTNQNRDVVSINLIPYNMQVNAGEAVLDNMNVTNQHGASHCVDFKTSHFAQSGIDPTVTYSRTGHFDPFYRSINHPNSTADDTVNRLFMCPTTDFSEIMLMSQNVNDLSDRIEALEAGGNTSIDIGVKWGMTFLDPSSRTLLNSLNGTDQAVDPIFSNRPAAYGDDDTIKIMVVMTDGINTDQYELDPDFSSGLSDVWIDPNSTILSVYDDRTNRYFITNTNYENFYYPTGPQSFNNGTRVYGDIGMDGSINTNRTDEYNKWSNRPYQSVLPGQPGYTSLDDARRLSYPELWSIAGVRYNAFYNQYRMRNRASEYWEWFNPVLNTIGQRAKNDRLTSACRAAKDEEIVIFSIGFEVTAASSRVLKDCASSDSHFFLVEGLEISDAFNAIAQTIQRLKLTN